MVPAILTSIAVCGVPLIATVISLVVVRRQYGADK